MTIGDKSYALLQFHLHAPSEHTVDGKHLPMEMHFVHQAEDGALAVIGVLMTIMLPAVSRARAQARVTAVNAELRQIGLALEIRGELLGGILLGASFAAELLALIALRTRWESA